MHTPTPGEIWSLRPARGATGPLVVVLGPRLRGWWVAPVFDEGLLAAHGDVPLPVGPANPDGAAWCAGDHRAVVPRSALLSRLGRLDEVTTARLRQWPHAGLWRDLPDPRIAARQARFAQLPTLRAPRWPWAAAAALCLGLGAAAWWATRPPPTAVQARGRSLVALSLAGDGRPRPLRADHQAGDRVVFRYSSPRSFLAVVAITGGRATPALPTTGRSVQVASGADQRGPVGFELDDDPRVTVLVFVFSEAPLDVATLAQALDERGSGLDAALAALRGPTVDVVVGEIPARQGE